MMTLLLSEHKMTTYLPTYLPTNFFVCEVLQNGLLMAYCAYD